MIKFILEESIDLDSNDMREAKLTQGDLGFAAKPPLLTGNNIQTNSFSTTMRNHKYQFIKKETLKKESVYNNL